MSVRALAVSLIGIGQIFAWGSSYYLLTVLADPIAKDTAWPLEYVMSALSIGLLTAGIVSPFIGRLIATQGGRLVLAASSIVLAMGLLLMALAHHLWIFLLSWVVIGCAMGAGLYDAAFATLGSMFGSKARLTITALTMVAGFSSTLCWPISQFLLQSSSWRGVCLAYAAINLIVCLSCYLALPRYVSVIQSSSESDHITEFHNHSDRASIFLLLAAIWIISGVISVAISVNVFIALESSGVDPQRILEAAILIGPAQVAGRLAEYLALRRRHPVWTVVLASALISGGLAMVIVLPALLIPGMLIYGAGAGISWVARGTLPLALFGRARYPIIMGRLATPNLLAQALTPPAAAALVQSAGGAVMLSAGGGLAAVSLVLALILARLVDQGVRLS
jgi:predicted MFS family arabinose efflux permease